MNRIFAFVACPLLISIISLVLYPWLQKVQTTTFPQSFLSKFHLHYNISSFQQINTIQYHHKQSLQLLIQQSNFQPFLLKNSPAKQWQAISKWQNVSYLRHQLKDTPLQRVTTVLAGYPYYYAVSKRPLPLLDQSYQHTWWQHTIKKKQTFDTFLSRCALNNLDSISTFYDYVQGWQHDFIKLQKDLLPQDWSTLQTLASSPSKSKRQIWMGCQINAGSHVHYDHSHNIITQLVGEKKFILTPPNQWNKFRDNPRISRLVSFSQRNFSQYNNNNESLIANSIVVILRPGDTLYLPPFWWHHVIAIHQGLTIGTNEFTEDPRIQLTSLLKMPLPTNVHVTNNNQTYRNTAAAMMLNILLKNILKQSSTSKKHQRTGSNFMKRIYENRYRDGNHLQKNCKDTRKENVGINCNDMFLLDPILIEIIPQNEIHDLFEQINTFDNWQTDDRIYSLPSKDAVEMMLADYVEELVSYVAGPRNVCHYLLCYSDASSIHYVT